MSDAVVSALLAAVATVTTAVFPFILGIRSLRRSMKTSDDVLGKSLETAIEQISYRFDQAIEQVNHRFDQMERRLERVEVSLAEVREGQAYERGRASPAMWVPRVPR